MALLDRFLVVERLSGAVPTENFDGEAERTGRRSIGEFSWRQSHISENANGAVVFRKRKVDEFARASDLKPAEIETWEQTFRRS